MDTSIVSAVITAISAIIVGVIGSFGLRHRDEPPDGRAVREQQLTNLFIPLERLLVFNPELPPKELLAAMAPIIQKHFALAPEVLIEEFLAIYDLSKPTAGTIEELCSMILSFSHWTRKSLGYPYSPARIKKQYTPVYKRNENIKGAAFMVLLAVSFVSWGAMINSFVTGNTPLPKWMTQVFFYLCLAEMFWVVARVLSYMDRRWSKRSSQWSE